MKVWCYFGPDGRICADSDFWDEAQAWRQVLGYPKRGEVEKAKQAGARVELIEIESPISK